MQTFSAQMAAAPSQAPTGAAGQLSWDIIKGNARADEAAARGAGRHSIPPEDIIHAEDDVRLANLQLRHLIFSLEI